MLRPIALSLLLLAAVGCDSTEETTLDTAYLTGTWTFDRVEESTNVDGQRETETIDALLDDYALTFQSDGAVRVIIDVSEQSSMEDVDATVPYTLTESTLRIGTSSDPPLSYTAAAIDDDEMSVTGDGLPVTILLGIDAEYDVNSPVTIRLKRR